DIAMPGLNGLDLVRRMGEESMPTQAVILSMHTDQEYVHRAIAAGARGYVLKGSGIEELSMAIQSVFRGEVFLSPAITRPIVECYLDPGGSRAIPGGELTPRQREVLRLIAEGETTKAVANRLGISAKTVEAHRSQLMERLQIYDVAGLVRYAIRTGLISSDPCSPGENLRLTTSHVPAPRCESSAPTEPGLVLHQVSRACSCAHQTGRQPGPA